MDFVILNQGQTILNTINTYSLFIKSIPTLIQSIALGTGVDYLPLSTMTGLQGNLVASIPLTQTMNVSQNSLNYIYNIPIYSTPAAFGEIALLSQNGTPLALYSYPSSQSTSSSGEITVSVLLSYSSSTGFNFILNGLTPQSTPANVVESVASTTITIGSTTTGLPGTAAQVINSGTQNAQILNFVIPQGSSGTAAQTLQAPAGTTISADTAVALVNGALVPAQSSVASQAGSVLGIAQNGGPSGTLINIQQSGEMVLSSWNWTLGQPIFVGLNGPLTQTAPTSGFSQIVGIPLSATSISVGLQPPILIV